jgi:hypothetical protein
VVAIAGDGFPTVDDVLQMRIIAKELAACVRARDCLLQCRRDREQTRHDIGVLEQSVAAIGAPADVTGARACLAKIETALAGLRDKRVEADNARCAAEESEGQLLTQHQELSIQITQLSGDVAASRADVVSARRQLDAAIALVPESHRTMATTIGARELQGLTDELAGLQDERVEEEFAALAQDRVLQADRERQLSEVEQQIAQLPPDARRCAADVEQEVSDAEAATRTAEQLYDQSSANAISAASPSSISPTLSEATPSMTAWLDCSGLRAFNLASFVEQSVESLRAPMRSLNGFRPANSDLSHPTPRVPERSICRCAAETAPSQLRSVTFQAGNGFGWPCRSRSLCVKGLEMRRGRLNRSSSMKDSVPWTGTVVWQ